MYDEVAAHIPNFDDISKTSFSIPYNPPSRTHQSKARVPRSHCDYRDLEDGRELRFSAYKGAWTKCLERMQKIVRDLQEASVKDIIEEVQGSYLNVLPGLPYPELPVITLTNSGFGSAVLDNITSELEHQDHIEISGGESRRCILVHLYPGDIPNITTGMRSIISGLTENEEVELGKRKSTTSLATYDINYLVAWYKAWVDSTDTKSNIVILLHDFEQFDPLVMQDIFYICSKYVSELPLVFLLSMTSPVPNYLNLTYPQTTLSLLRVRQFSTPAGNKILETLILETFFDMKFQVDVMMGPAVLKYLHDYFTRYNPSVDVIFTILQLAHLRHFSSDPITILVKDSPSSANLSNPQASPFLESILNRISVTGDEDIDADSSASSALAFLGASRSKFHRGLYSMKLGFQLLLLMHSFLEEQGHNGLSWSSDSQKRGRLWDAMMCVLEGKTSRVMKDLRLIIRKLKQDELRSALERIYHFIQTLPVSLSSVQEEQEAKAKTVNLRTDLSQCDDDRDMIADVANKASEWIVEYLASKLQPLESYPLWDIWYTGLSPFPSEIINPSIRASLMSGLLQPHAFAEQLDPPSSHPASASLRDLPDTSILFKRYLDSSRMINVYDWFDSFKSVLEEQREHYKSTALPAAQAPTTPRKRGKGRGKQKAQPQAEEAEMDDATWNAHVQARFIRALHELDYLGLIKHTGRKADHLIRTLFDIDDAQ